MTAVLVLAALVLLRWGFLLLVTAVLVPEVRGCPACFASTLPVRRRWLTRLVPWIQWRWCAQCGWQGPARTSAGGLTPPVGERPASAPKRPAPPSPSRDSRAS